jgi:REP element-mobilizing transposase RayT
MNDTGDMGSRQQQLSFMPRTRAKGGGRKPAGDRAGVPHIKRPELSSRHPVHVTLKTVPAVGYLRKAKLMRALRRAAVCSIAWSRARGIFRICHISVQGNHIHLIVEAECKQALSRGMQGFMISSAKRINALLGRSGRVYADRYHAHILTNPRHVRSALAYVLNNWRHHGLDRLAPGALIDPCATGYAFNGWSEDVPLERIGERELFWLWYPKTWLLAMGWKQHGLISAWEVPGAA